VPPLLPPEPVVHAPAWQSRPQWCSPDGQSLLPTEPLVEQQYAAGAPPKAAEQEPEAFPAHVEAALVQ
jgi:hypothetical protein